MATVLFVDDSPSVRRAYGAELTKEGYHVVLATDGDEALEIAARQEIDVVILDVHMRRLGGVATMARLRATCPTLPVVLHSSYRENDVLRQSQHKPDAYVSKSGDCRELNQAVAALLAKHDAPTGRVSVPPLVHRMDRAEQVSPHTIVARADGCRDDG